MAFLTQDDLRRLMAMQDFGGQEDELASQRALATQLRAPVLGQGAKRMDWASQAARGLSGIMSGYQGMQNKEMVKGMGEEKRKLLKSFLEPEKEEQSEHEDWY